MEKKRKEESGDVSRFSEEDEIKREFNKMVNDEY